MKCQCCSGLRETADVRICSGCERWLSVALEDLEAFYSALLTATALQPVHVPQDPDPTAERVPNALPARSAKPKSKSPARDETIVLTDRRSKDARGNPTSIPGVLRDWSGRIEELNGTRPGFYVTGWTDHIRGNWATSVRQAWIAPVVRNVKLVHHQAARLLAQAEEEPSPVGRCDRTGCDGEMWLEGHLVICGECGQYVDGFDLVRDHQAAQLDVPGPARMTTIELSVLLDAKPGTVRQWISRSGVVRDKQGKVEVAQITEWLADRPSVGVA